MVHTASKALLSEVEAFLKATGMGPAYFGKQSCGNSEIVNRLRTGGRVWPETEAKIRAYMLFRKHSNKHMSARASIQPQVVK